MDIPRGENSNRCLKGTGKEQTRSLNCKKQESNCTHKIEKKSALAELFDMCKELDLQKKKQDKDKKDFF